MRELEGERKADYDRSERRIGITKEVWYLARTPGGDQFVAYMESGDFGRALALSSQSQDEFDLWFKRRLAGSTGLDLNTPPPPRAAARAPVQLLGAGRPAAGRPREAWPPRTDADPANDTRSPP
jgi:hypothetical protein